MTDTMDSRLRGDIINALKMVYDPEIPVNIWDLGLIYNIEIRDTGLVVIKMTMTSPTCPMAEEIMQWATAAVEQVPGVGQVMVELVWSPPWNLSMMSETARLELDLTESGW